MKTIIVPDVHQRVDFVKYILETEKDYDEVVFLSDWFDSFWVPPKVAGFEETCKYLKHLILEHPNKDKFVFLLGNHDISYIYNNNDSSAHRLSKTIKYYCSGFTASKAKKFRHQFYDCGLKDNFFLKYFKPVHRTQGWTLSHAGLSEKHIPYGKTPDDLIEGIISFVWKNFRDFTVPHHYLISGAGFARGGDCNVGGVLWLDWNMEFEASEAIGKQIVGHTTVREPECRHMNTEKESWNLDTERDYGIIINGRVTTKRIPELNEYKGTLRHDS
jgi:hypothetical protein